MILASRVSARKGRSFTSVKKMLNFNLKPGPFQPTPALRDGGGERQSNHSKGCHTVVQKALIGEKDESSNVVSTFVKTMPIESAGFLLFSTSVMPHTLSALHNTRAQLHRVLASVLGFSIISPVQILPSRPFLVSPMPCGMLLQRLSE